MARWGVVLIVVAALLVAPAVPAVAETVVTPGRKTVTLTVKVDCVGCKGKKGPDGRSLAKYWEKTAETFWNAAFGDFKYCDKYTFELDVDMETRDAGAARARGRNGLAPSAPGSGYEGTGWDGIPRSPNPPAADHTSLLLRTRDGTMPPDATPAMIAFEFGQVLGLGGDRDSSGYVLPGREGTLMTGGAYVPDGTIDGTPVGPDTPLTIDQQLIDRIGDQLANLGKVDCGQLWKGSIRGTGTDVGDCTRAKFRGDFIIRVRDRGIATLSGRMQQTWKEGCPPAEFAFRVEGTKTPSSFQFPEAGTSFPWSVEMQVSGSRASGTAVKSIASLQTTLKLKARRSDAAAS